jgi:hypothetical protein
MGNSSLEAAMAMIKRIPNIVEHMGITFSFLNIVRILVIIDVALLSWKYVGRYTFELYLQLSYSK